jgi:DNA repair protein RadC
MALNKQRISIKNWAEDDRPREKLLLKGKNSLSDAELIAILIGSGNNEESAVELSKRILQACSNNLNKLAKLSVNDLQQFKGIGEAKAISIVAAMELARRRKDEKISEDYAIKSSNDAYQILQSFLSDLPHEEFWMLNLSRNNKVKSKFLISRGGISGTVVDTRIIFKQAIQELASGIILAHNHPSGNIQPSEQDFKITEKIKKAGELLDIKLIDHIIIGDKNYYSFVDEGKL